MDFEELFRELEEVVIERREIICVRQQIGRRVRWMVEINDQERVEEFEGRLAKFLRKLRGERCD